jgi:hypothetical protein
MRARNATRVGLGVLLLLVSVGGGTAVAADHALLVGQSNTADATTSLSNSAGTALALTSKSGSPPLRVSGRTKVANLNADLVDGLSAGDLALSAGRTGVIVGSESDADGYVNTARCPTGTIATGGGGYASGTRDYLYYSGPDFSAGGSLIPNSWFAVADGDVVAWVVCYNPRGVVAGATTTRPAMSARGAGAASAQKLPGQHASQKDMP